MRPPARRTRAQGKRTERTACVTSLPCSTEGANRGHLHLVKTGPGRFATIGCFIHLEVREEGRRLGLEQSNDGHGKPANFHLCTLPGSQLEHRSPGTHIG